MFSLHAAKSWRGTSGQVSGKAGFSQSKVCTPWEAWTIFYDHSDTGLKVEGHWRMFNKTLAVFISNQSPRLMCGSREFLERQNDLGLKDRSTPSGQLNIIPHGILMNFDKTCPHYALGFVVITSLESSL